MRVVRVLEWVAPNATYILMYMTSVQSSPVATRKSESIEMCCGGWGGEAVSLREGGWAVGSER